MDPLSLRKQLMDNTNDLKDFCKELKEWSNEMKVKEANRNEKQEEYVEIVEQVPKKSMCGTDKLNKKAEMKQSAQQKKCEVEIISGQKEDNTTPKITVASSEDQNVYSSFCTDKTGTICLIKPIHKSVVERSKVPLKRIQIIEAL